MAVSTPVRRPRIASLRRLSPLSVAEALVTPHGLDRYLELVHPLLTVRELRAVVTDVARPTPDTTVLTLRPTRQWRGFVAGQFVQVTVDVDGVRRTRCYSPSCSEYRRDGRIEIAVKQHDGGVVSQYLRAHAAPGLVVGLSQAQGNFVLPPARPDRIVLLSGGSGITPVLSMLRTLRDEGYAGSVTLLHYARTSGDVVALDELRAMAAERDNVTVLLSCTKTAEGDLHGRFDEQHLKTAAAWYAEAETYVCGPAPLLSAVRDLYREAGIEDRLHSESFTLNVPVADASATGTVSFARSDRRADNTGATLLEQAEAAGLTPEYGCRMGICFSCVQVKTSGCTRNVLTGETDNDPDSEVQLCVNVPVGDVELDI